eukprot:scaffold14091_cov28-Tisochrysis_lutea.AAC.8
MLSTIFIQSDEISSCKRKSSSLTSHVTYSCIHIGSARKRSADTGTGDWEEAGGGGDGTRIEQFRARPTRPLRRARRRTGGRRLARRFAHAPCPAATLPLPV